MKKWNMPQTQKRISPETGDEVVTTISDRQVLANPKGVSYDSLAGASARVLTELIEIEERREK